MATRRPGRRLVQRARGVARGIANTETRAGYIAALARRLGADLVRSGEHERPAGYATPIRHPRRQCLVCGGERLIRKRVTYARDDALQCRVHQCRDCRYVRIIRPGPGHYLEATSLEDLPLGARTGTMAMPGREFHMGKMAADILGRSALDVLITGIGRSMDNHHLLDLPEIDDVAIGDIMKLRDDGEFVNVLEPPPRRFDLVIASEVVEHFRRPRPDFALLFEGVKDDGLIVCSTDIRSTRPLRTHRYIFYPDHTSFYSPESLLLVARAHGFHLDFRSTLAGDKRYVFLSRSAEVMERVACYFGLHPYAPSEVAQPKRPPAERAHRRWRAGAFPTGG